MEELGRWGRGGGTRGREWGEPDGQGEETDRRGSGGDVEKKNQLIIE